MQDFTYAALGRGIQCYCSNVKGNSSLLHYVDSAHCDIPCSGDRRYHCGGENFFSLYRTVVKGENNLIYILHMNIRLSLISTPY